jgi:hypothetical protein
MRIENTMQLSCSNGGHSNPRYVERLKFVNPKEKP